MREHKIVFAGTAGAGKTTAIAAISETAPVVTDMLHTDGSTGPVPAAAAVDYGAMTLDNGERLRLFGAPSQTRFDFTWSILIRDAMGLIILVDNSRAAPLDDLQMFLDAFADNLRAIPCVIGVVRTDTHPSPKLDDFADALAARRLLIPVLGVDVRQRDDVVMLVDVLLAAVEASLPH